MNKSDLELLRPIWMPRSFAADKVESQSLKLFLIDGNYFLNNTPNEVTIYVPSCIEVRRALSSDAFRMITHAAQTVFELEKTSAYSKLTSWRVIQTYYAAFFAAHACLRFFGRSFSQLEGGHVDHLNQRCSSEVGYNPKIGSGFHLIEFDDKTQTLSFAKYKDSHKGLWECFHNLLKDISNQLLSARASEQRRQQASLNFDNLAQALRNNDTCASGNWLSVMRNEVNYKSTQGVWYPFSSKTPDFHELISRVKNWRNCENGITEPHLVNNELERFFVSAFDVLELSMAVALDYSQASNEPNIGSMAFSRLLNESAAA